MREGVLKFVFEKTDGSIRTACGTLVNVPAGATNKGKKMTKPSYKTFSYFDTDKNEFRCSKIKNLIMIYQGCLIGYQKGLVFGAIPFENATLI